MSFFERPPECRLGLTLGGEVVVLLLSTVRPCLLPALSESSGMGAWCGGGKEKLCLSILFKIKGPSKAGRVIKLDLEDF